jgi:hypothetical protein
LDHAADAETTLTTCLTKIHSGRFRRKGTEVTAVVGLVHDGDVYMGADSAGSSTSYIALRSDPKVFITGSYLIGYTTSFRMGQLLKYSFEAPKPPDTSDDLMRFMATEFIDAIRSCFKSGGWSEIEKNRETGGSFLVGVSGRLFEVEGDYQLSEETQGYAACGSGALVALGSMHTTAYTSFGPYKRIELALKAAEYFTPGVRGPYNILTLKS